MAQATNGVGRPWEPREQRLCAEYVAKFFPGERTKFQVRVGNPRMGEGVAIPTPEENPLAYNRRPAVDAMVIRAHEIVLIETYIRIDLGKVSQLEIYKSLVPLTPYADYDVTKPIRMLIVGALEDPLLTQHARSRGIEFHLYKPDWIETYLQSLDHRKQGNKPALGVNT